MNIKRAKEEIKRSVRAYLAKDAPGGVCHPRHPSASHPADGPVRASARPRFWSRPPGNAGWPWCPYTITHHTRQSAVGLPFIRQKHYGDRDVSVTEYTMSEIIASIYEKMEVTGLKEGILFIDEINCVSETLAPTMLQFLQCKTFGNQPSRRAG